MAPRSVYKHNLLGMQISEDDLNWLAGLLEGEGSFMAGPPSAPNRPSISVHMTDEDVIRRVATLFDIGFVQIIKGKRAHHKTSYAVRLRGARAVELMKLLEPLMGIRRQDQIKRVVSSYVPKNRKTLAHGTHAMYNKARCRCDDCKLGHREHIKEWRTRRVH